LLEDGIVNLATASGRKESELEDLIEVEKYRSAIESKYYISLDNPRFRGTKKWSDRIEAVFRAHGKPWDDRIKNDVKSLVSRQVASAPENTIRPIDGAVVDALISTLANRLREREAPSVG
jgi:hypothetical protein